MSAPLTTPGATALGAGSTGLERLDAAAGRGARAASPSAAAGAAGGFEQLLVSQLSQSLVAGSGLESTGEEGEGSAAQPGGGVVSSLVSQALSEAVTRGGGLGLAGRQHATATPAERVTPSGGTAA
jgi:hypothetical protein